MTGFQSYNSDTNTSSILSTNFPPPFASPLILKELFLLYKFVPWFIVADRSSDGTFCHHQYHLPSLFESFLPPLTFPTTLSILFQLSQEDSFLLNTSSNVVSIIFQYLIFHHCFFTSCIQFCVSPFL